jgi:hypothetical protein
LFGLISDLARDRYARREMTAEESATGNLDLSDDLRIAQFQDVDPPLADGGG